MDKSLELLPKSIAVNKDKTAVCFFNVSNRILLGKNKEEWFSIEPEDWEILLNHCGKKTRWESAENGKFIFLYNYHEHHFINPKAEIETECWQSKQLLSKILRDKMPTFESHK